MRERPVAVRWTIGDVSARGFTALRYSVLGAVRLFGPEAKYVVCLNSVPLEVAKERTGSLPDFVAWRVADQQISPRIRPWLDERMAEGVGWKFAPVRCFPDHHELSLDNDCILFAMPEAIRRWLDDPRPSFVIAEDVRPCFGQFSPLCGDEPRNSGIRGLPAGFDYESALERLLESHPVRMTSELDEQGLQVAAVQKSGTSYVVRNTEVTICSPFPPHQTELGTCGVHFVGLNARRLSWSLNGRPAELLTAENFERLRPELHQRLGLPLTDRGVHPFEEIAETAQEI